MRIRRKKSIAENVSRIFKEKRVRRYLTSNPFSLVKGCGYRSRRVGINYFNFCCFIHTFITRLWGKILHKKH